MLNFYTSVWGEKHKQSCLIKQECFVLILVNNTVHLYLSREFSALLEWEQDFHPCLVILRPIEKPDICLAIYLLSEVKI